MGPLLEARPEKDMIILRARDVMTRDLMTLEPVESVSNLFKLLQSCSHHGFPVLQANGTFVGLIKRVTIVQVLMRSKAYDGFQEPSGRLMDPPPMVPYKDERNLRSLKDIRSSL